MRRALLVLALVLATVAQAGKVVQVNILQKGDMDFVCIYCGRENRKPGDVYAFSFILPGPDGKPEHHTAHLDCYEKFVTEAEAKLKSAGVEHPERYLVPLQGLLSMTKRKLEGK